MTTSSPVEKFHQYLVESKQAPVETIELVAKQASVTRRCVLRYIRSKLVSSPESACYRYVVPPKKDDDQQGEPTPVEVEAISTPGNPGGDQV